MSALQEEYRIIAAGAGWIERIDRGHVRIDGRDAAAFLQALVTNDVAALRTAFLAQGFANLFSP